MNNYATAWDVLPSVDEMHDESVENRIAYGTAVALLSISQELSGIRQGEGKGVAKIESHLSTIAARMSGEDVGVTFPYVED